MGLTPIQMPLFFDAGTTNALLYVIFWMAFGGVIGGVLLIWGWLENRRRAHQWRAPIINGLTRHKAE